MGNLTTLVGKYEIFLLSLLTRYFINMKVSLLATSRHFSVLFNRHKNNNIKICSVQHNSLPRSIDVFAVKVCVE